jgi:hypothetical protein
MGQITQITLTDGAITPVNRVFKPARREGTLYEFHNRANGIAVGYDKVFAEYRLPTKQLKSTKVAFKVVTPTLEQTSASTSSGIQPAPQKAYECIGKLEFVLPERSTEQDRKNVLQMVRDLIDEQLVTDAVQTLDPIYF